jgi:hypothetical protein
MINITNELSDVHKKIMDKLIETIMVKQQDMVKHNIRYEVKQYQDTTNKELEKTQKQLSE